jgi:hypothetical protein
MDNLNKLFTQIKGFIRKNWKAIATGIAINVIISALRRYWLLILVIAIIAGIIIYWDELGLYTLFE